jgi:pyruvate dehydrogenase E1 component alpha subunit
VCPQERNPASTTSPTRHGIRLRLGATENPRADEKKECKVTHSADFGPGLVEVFGPSQADGGPELVQLLTPEGERVEHPEFSFDPGEGVDEADAIRGLYRDMVLTRRIDTEATALQRHGELGIWAQLLGQEAAQIGAGRALRPQDFVFPTYREHGVAWCRGVDPIKLLGLFRGVDQGSWDPNENNFGLYTIVIGAQTLHATGYAMGIQRDGAVGTGDPDRDAAVIAHFGDGASSQGDVNEAFIFAASYNAPVVFFCQNNQWAISEPIERQSRIPLYQRALGFGFPGVRVDGNDVLASYAVTKAALQRARDGQGPTFVEAYTYRMGAHTTTDDPTRYRHSEDVEHWKHKDPIARVEVYLRRNGLADDAFFHDLTAEADALGGRLREGCRALPDPKPLGVFDHVYSEMTEELGAQRDEFATYLESFDSEGAHS